jgi:3-hydroxyacyl-CoA dehydrogenase
VEAGIGVIPGWGGCKELLWRHVPTSLQADPTKGAAAGGPMPGISKVFETISTAKVAASAEDAREMRIIAETGQIVMNRRRVLAEAKARCIALAKDYTAPQRTTRHLPGETGEVALNLALENFRRSGKATQHDVVVSSVLAHVLCGGATDITREVTEEEILRLEHDGFMELAKTEATRERIAHMLTTGKPLRN